MNRQHRLRLFVFDRNETHIGTPNRLTDRFRVVRIILAALAVRRHELTRHQARIVSKPLELSRPVMRTSTGFDADHTGRHISKEPKHLPA